MPIRVVRLGTPRAPDEGLRLGTVRRPPRGIKKADYGRLHYFDLWLPDLAPSAALVKYAYAEPWTSQRWAIYARRYRSEMRTPTAQRLIMLLAALSSQANFAIGCYCEDETRCHRSLLRELLAEAKATML
jgi:uncharacterized protein YeaO (DUF488 family)